MEVELCESGGVSDVPLVTWPTGHKKMIDCGIVVWGGVRASPGEHISASLFHWVIRECRSPDAGCRMGLCCDHHVGYQGLACR